MRAGLKRDIRRGATHIRAGRRRIAQRHDFRMGAARLLGEAVADHPAVWRHQYAADTRVGAGKKKRLGGEPKRLVHEGRCGGHGTLDGSVGCYLPQHSSAVVPEARLLALRTPVLVKVKSPHLSAA